MHVEEAYATWDFSIVLISMRVEVVQILDFLVLAKILQLCKAFFTLNLLNSTLGKKDIALMLIYLTSHVLFRSSSISTNCWGTLYFEYFLANVITVKCLLLGKLQTICLQSLKIFFFFWPYA